MAFIIQISDISPRACEFCKAHAHYVPVRQIRGRRNINIMGGNYSAMDPMEVPVPDIEVLFQRDGYLKPYEREIRRRWVLLSFTILYKKVSVIFITKTALYTHILILFKVKLDVFTYCCQGSDSALYWSAYNFLYRLLDFLH